MTTDVLRVLVVGGPDAGWVDSLSAAVQDRTGNRSTCDSTVIAPTRDVAAALDTADLERTDVCVITVGAFDAPVGDPYAALEVFRQVTTAAIDLLKRHQVTVLLLNGSTVRPGSHLAGMTEVAALNLGCLELSVETGVSVIDVDRAIAELGADEHVLAPLTYSDAAHHAISDVVADILVDYGFFDDRPVLAQVGRGRAAKEHR
jgi:hypothetical protein